MKWVKTSNPMKNCYYLQKFLYFSVICMPMDSKTEVIVKQVRLTFFLILFKNFNIIKSLSHPTIIYNINIILKQTQFTLHRHTHKRQKKSAINYEGTRFHKIIIRHMYISWMTHYCTLFYVIYYSICFAMSTHDHTRQIYRYDEGIIYVLCVYI